MAIEKRWIAIPPRAFTVDGSVDGKVTVTDTYPFKVKQHIEINATGQPQLFLEVKRVVSKVLLLVGPIGGSIDTRTNLTLYTVTSSANIGAHEQQRSNVPEEKIPRNVYEEEPVVAIRTFPVDEEGDPYNSSNPFPVDATVVLPPDLAVRITASDNDPNAGDVHSSIRISDGTNELHVNPDGSINVNLTTSSSEPSLQILHSEITSVASGVESTIATLIAPLAGYRVEKIDVSGDNYAIFRVKLNGTTIFTKRTWWANFNEAFDFERFDNGLLLTSGQTLTVTAIHNRPFMGAFEATILYLN